MTALRPAIAVHRLGRIPWRQAAPAVGAAVAFGILFAQPIQTLVRDWWNSPDAGHGLLLTPIAIWLMWKSGRHPHARPQAALGLVVLVAAVALRYLSGLAAELFTMRLSLLGAALGAIVFVAGWRQLARWWLPIMLLALSVPVPDVLIGTLALPLQLAASQFGAMLLDWRHVPVNLAGNVIHLPGQSLFVTEACSGLRSLTALLALALLIGGLWLRSPWTRAAIALAAIPVAMLLNGVRIFLTGFLVHFVDPGLGEGVMHYTEGWFMFVFAFVALAGLAWLLVRLEGRRPTTPMAQQAAA